MRGYALFVVAILGLIAFAPGAKAGGDPPPARQVWIGTTPEGVRYIQQSGDYTNLSAEARATYRAGAANAEIVRTTYHKIPVSASRASLGRLGMGALARLAGRAIPIAGTLLTLKDLAEAANYTLKPTCDNCSDPAYQWFFNDASEQAELNPHAYCWLGFQPLRCANNPTAMKASGDMVYAPRTVEYYGTCGENCHIYTIYNTDGSVFTYGGPTWTQMPGDGWLPENNHNPQAYPGTPMTAEQMGELVQSNPAIINAVLIDPETGKPVPFPELNAALNDLRRSLEAASTAAGEDLTPGTDLPETDTDYPSDPVVGEGSDYPEFCSWAGVVCDFIDWMKEEPTYEKPELPVEELEIEPSDWVSGIGGGACPGPIAIQILDGEAEFEWTPICDAVVFLKPFMLLLAGLSAAFIVAGVRMGKNN